VFARRRVERDMADDGASSGAPSTDAAGLSRDEAARRAAWNSAPSTPGLPPGPALRWLDERADHDAGARSHASPLFTSVTVAILAIAMAPTPRCSASSRR
jgi:transcription elongation factor